PFLLAIGALCLAGGGSFVMLALGRALMGVGHALTVVSGLTALLRFGPAGAVGSALTAFEMSAVIGGLRGTVSVTLLPSWRPWDAASLIGCAPQLLTFAVLPRLLTAIPRDSDGVGRPIFARERGRRSASAPVSAGVLLAFAAGLASALAYSTLEQFVIPFRGQREFALDRHGIAGLLMIAQTIDVVCLLPFGLLVDRVGVGRVLGPTLMAFGVGTVFIALGDFGLVVAGCVHRAGRLAVTARTTPTRDAGGPDRLANGRLPRRCRRRHLSWPLPQRLFFRSCPPGVARPVCGCAPGHRGPGRDSAVRRLFREHGGCRSGCRSSRGVGGSNRPARSRVPASSVRDRRNHGRASTRRARR